MTLDRASSAASPTIDSDHLPLPEMMLQTSKRWHKIVTVDSTAKLLRQYPVPESPAILSTLRQAELSRLDRAYQWSATKPHFEPIRESLQQFAQSYRWLLWLAMFGVFMLGCLGSWGLLVTNAQGRINIFWWLLAFLGWPLCTLMMWLLLFALPIKTAAPVSSLLEHLTQRLQSRLQRWQTLTPVQEQVASGIYAFFQQPHISRWFSASLLHTAWLLYLLGGTAVLILKLSFEHYIFVWQTSLIPTSTFASIIESIGFLPNLLGFNVPNTSLIEASRWVGYGGSAMATEHWASFMIGCAITYGVIPRLLFFLLSYFSLRHQLNHAKLIPNHPHYGNYLRLLMPNIESSVGGMIITNEHIAGIVIRQPLGDPQAKIHWIRYESMINRPFSLRQTHENSILLIDIDDLDSHDKAVREISKLAPNDAFAVCIAVNIFQVPDEGFKQFLQRILAVTQVRIILLLTGSELMRQHGEQMDIASRIDSWGQTASAAQLDAEDCIVMEGATPDDARETLTTYLNEQLAKPLSNYPYTP